MTIKDKAYIVLKSLGGRATEGELVDKYIEMYPDYDNKHNPTNKTSKEKIRGSISAVLILNSTHKNIKVDKNKKPQEYYIINQEEEKPLIVIQPIGKNNTIDDFLEYNSTRWAEKLRYKTQWEKLVNSIVLFIKDGEVFAKGDITKIEESEDETYPLDFYYNLTLVDNIDYKKIIEYAKPKLGNFRNYELLDFETSNAIIKYINSQKLIYVDDEHADIELQDSINKIDSFQPENTPQQVKNSKEIKGSRIFPRNLAYAKFALEKASYLCEIDNEHMTFISNSSKNQYVEAHHLVPLKVQDEFIYSIMSPSVKTT